MTNTCNKCHKWAERMAVILEAIILTSCPVIWSGKLYVWLSVWEFRKLWLWQPCSLRSRRLEVVGASKNGRAKGGLRRLATISQQAHACWKWETDHIQLHLYVDISYKFTFSRMYTNNYEHLHKWFGTFYRDSVRMKACIFNHQKSWSLSLFAWTASLMHCYM